MRRHVITILLFGLLLAGCGMSPEAAKQRGFAFYDLKQFKDAFPLLEKAYKKGLDDPELVVRLAYCRAIIGGDPAAAIAILRDSVLKYPKYARTYFELGFIAQQFGPNEGQANVKQALGFTRKAVALDSTDWLSVDNLGMFYFMLGDLDSAEIWFKAASRLKSNDAELNARLAQIAELKAKRDSLKTTEDTLRLGH
jgi:tetratricopeptide (TPR) repeat protein